MKNIRTDLTDSTIDGPERDACAIYLSARKQGQSTFGTLKRSLGALIQMGHRTGFVNGEGDGAGVQTDIPRRLWAKKLSQAGLPSYIATNPGFWVGHIFIPRDMGTADLREQITQKFNQAGLNLLIAQPGRTRPESLGQNARINPPYFWQIAGFADIKDLDKRLLVVQLELEKLYPIHFASLSSHTVVYKVRGSVESLARYYPDLHDNNYDTAMVLCHARYSTNTVSNFERAQPFAFLGHNGEINTIQRLRIEAKQIGVTLARDGSDSQDLDRTLHTLCVEYNLSLLEAMEIIFPPVPHELETFPADLRAVYSRLRQVFGPYAQGPAGIVARYGNTIIASVDALGLRPLWFIETEKEYVFCSERGAVPLEVVVGEPKPLAPGEKMAIAFHRGEHAEVLTHRQIRQQVMLQTFQREAPQLASQYWGRAGVTKAEKNYQGLENSPRNLTQVDVLEVQPPVVFVAEGSESPAAEKEIPALPWVSQPTPINYQVLSANGWLVDHIKEVEALASPNKEELISSLGYDGPLAALSKTRVNLADYFKESVAVVTNPAIDHTRESEAFSTSTLIGACPNIGTPPDPNDHLVVLEAPILLGGCTAPVELMQNLALKFGTLTIEQLLASFDTKTAWLVLGVYPDETIPQALERLSSQAVEHVRSGKQCLVLDDSESIEKGLGWLDPHLAASHLDQTLRQAASKINLRRRAGIIVRSAAVRNLHDLALLCAFGADAVNPYGLYSVGLQAHAEPVDAQQAEINLEHIVENLKTGLEKVISTMGCHELRGYGRVCGSIGLAPEISQVFSVPNYFGSGQAGVTWETLKKDSLARAAELRDETHITRLARQEHFYPKFYKKAHAYAKSEIGYGELNKTFQTLSAETPVALRHIIGIRHISDIISPSDVDISIGDYNLPLVIEAMSFGSQGETSYRAYAHAASLLNIVCVNGEGGELPDLLGLYKKNRGQQVASGRFGVNVEFLNSAAVLEIKIGQGAKPGEGGMLPGYKNSPQVALARRTPPNVTLLSPSNNHDLYSIEDLAQLIEELRMVNPNARISVKIPVVPGIGVIAVGVAKAGADIINICGYDGGTGAARKHSLQYVGLPTEIGVIQAHRALVDAGIRHKVEIWCNGGMKTGQDVVKMILLGANRVGFATMAMVAIGCTICRQCNLGTCHVGICTQIKNSEEAEQKGLKHFTPLQFGTAVERLLRLFKGLSEEIRALTAQLGSNRLQDLVGRADLLEQIAFKDSIDLSPMFEPMPIKPRPQLEPGVGILLIRPRNSLTSILTDLVMDTLNDDEREVTYQDTVMAIDRALGTRLAGEMIRNPQVKSSLDCVHLRLGPSSVAGNGFAAWLTDKVDILIEGGAQDGVAKGACGGRVAVMKGVNNNGMRVDGSVGKSFAYAAQSGSFIVQGNADSRACVRLCGADVVLGGEITAPVDDAFGSLGSQSNLKGFACEYMTAGHVLIMGDPGPYAFSGMTGGTVYQKLTPEFGFDEKALRRRFARGASVAIHTLDASDINKIRAMLTAYIEALEQTYQSESAEHIRSMLEEAYLKHYFIKVKPINQ